MIRGRPDSRWSACLAVALGVAPVCAQDLPADKPAILPTKAVSKQERERIEAKTLFGLGALHEKKNRLLEALRCYEEASKLDPEAVAPRRALVPLYLALDRLDDACTAAQRVLELDPDDWETGHLYSRQLRVQGNLQEAAAVLRKAVGSPRAKDRPDARVQLWADLAMLHEAASAWDQAEAALQELAALLDRPAALLEQDHFTAEEIASQAGETYERLGHIRLKAGRPDRAVAAFETARVKDPARAARLALNLAEVLDRQGRPREALTRLNEYLTTQPAGMEGYEMKVRLLTKLGEANRVVPALESAAIADRNNRSLTLLLAREYRRAGRAADAERLYNRLVKEGPGPDVYRGLFGLFREKGPAGGDQTLWLLNEAAAAASKDDDAPDAIPKKSVAEKEKGAANGRAMLAALRDEPELVKLLLTSAGNSLKTRPAALEHSTRMLLAALAERTRQLGTAEELYRSCLEQAPMRAGEAQVYAGYLNVLSRARKHVLVIALCKKGLAEAQATNRALFFDYLWRAYLATDQFKEALDAADEMVKLATREDRLPSQCERVHVLSQAGRHAEAIAACQGMLKEYNQLKEIRTVRMALALAFGAAHDYDKSEEQLRLVLEGDPDHATANNDLGYQWADRNKNLDEAEKLIRKAIDLDRRQRSSGTTLGLDGDRDNAAYVDSLGWVLFRKGNLKGARAELEKAAALPGGDDDPVVWDHLGDVLFRQGEKGKAAEMWTKALALYDAGHRRKDERYPEIQAKLRQSRP